MKQLYIPLPTLVVMDDPEINKVQIFLRFFEIFFLAFDIDFN